MAEIETTRYKCRHRPCEGTILKMPEGVFQCSDCGAFWYPPKPRPRLGYGSRLLHHMQRAAIDLETAADYARLMGVGDARDELLVALEAIDSAEHILEGVPPMPKVKHAADCPCVSCQHKGRKAEEAP